MPGQAEPDAIAYEPHMNNLIEVRQRNVSYRPKR